MQKSASISKLPSTFKRVNDVPLIMENDDSPQRSLSSSSSPPSSPSSSKDVSSFFKSTSGKNILKLKTPDPKPRVTPKSVSSMLNITKSIGSLGSASSQNSTSRMQSMINKEVSAADEARNVVANARKKASAKANMDPEKRRKALKHTSIDVNDDRSDDEETIAPENEEDRAFIDDSDNLEDSEEGEESSDEDLQELYGDHDDSSQEEENDVSLAINLAREDEENNLQDELIEKKDFDTSEEETFYQIAQMRKYLKPIDMTFVPGLSMGGYGACTIRNVVLVLLNSAMGDRSIYDRCFVPRVQAILTAMTEYNNKLPIAKGSTEGTVMAYRLWLHTREKLRKSMISIYHDTPEMLEFLEALTCPTLLDSFFIAKKDFPIEQCVFTGNITDMGFEIVSCIDQSRVGVLWFDSKDQETAQVALAMMRLWFLPFTLRSFIEQYVDTRWPKPGIMTKRDEKMHYLENIQPLVYNSILALIQSFLDLFEIFKMRIGENTELSYT